MPQGRQRRIDDIFSCDVKEFLLLCLGLPLCAKPLDSIWEELMDRFNMKLVGWKGVILSQIGNIHLIKSTLQNLQT